MKIGEQIRNARIKAGFTQEQAANAIGVSRQTISNWENEKTYPDIVSVVRMSEKYEISLDLLLKGENTENAYLEYLEKSTDLVKSRSRLTQIILLSVYFGIWSVSLLSFWLFDGGADAFGYSIMWLWILLPVTTFSVSVFIGKNDYWGQWKWMLPVLFGCLYLLAEYGTFELANMIAFEKVNLPEFILLPVGAFFSLMGIGAGTGIAAVCRNEKKNRKKQRQRM